MFSKVGYYTFVTLLVSAGAQRFPSNFLFGGGTSAFQAESGWNVDGKGPSVLDINPKWVNHPIDGDVGSKSYYYYLDDVNATESMNFNFYRFSIAWTRILPNGDLSFINRKGIDYYDNLINSLRKRNIEPIITMSHFDWPVNMQLLGGLANKIFVDYFVDYANLLFKLYGDRVKYWITFNEPYNYCSTDGAATRFKGTTEYLCGQTVLLAHSSVYHLYKASFYGRFRGKIGITLNSYFYYPKRRRDVSAAERALQFQLGWFASPLFSRSGNYPQIMIDRIGRNSKLEGLPKSRLPTLSRELIQQIRGSADFLGLNYYTSRIVENVSSGPKPSYQWDKGVKETGDPSWKESAMPGKYTVPSGLGDLLRWIKNQYSNPTVLITENGYADSGGRFDIDRIDYLRRHLIQLQKAITVDGCNVIGYSVWSLIDSYEFGDRGYTHRFGLYDVDMLSDRRERTPKLSAKFMKQLATTHIIPPLPIPDESDDCSDGDVYST